MKNQSNLRTLWSWIIILLLATILPFCKSTQPATAVPDEIKVSYETDILPVMQASCTPCHFPETGRKLMLNTLEATQTNINDILRRVQLPADADGYMPFKSKREALTPEQIEMFKTWARQGFPQ